MTKPHDARMAVRAFTFCVVLGASIPVSTWAAPNEPVAPAVQGANEDPALRFERDRAACLSGRSGQDQATCLREAGAALQAARRDELTSGDGHLQQNAEARCKVFAGADRSDCLARVRGEGTVSGSVEGGGILRETVTIVPATATATAPAPALASSVPAK